MKVTKQQQFKFNTACIALNDTLTLELGCWQGAGKGLTALAELAQELHVMKTFSKIFRECVDPNFSARGVQDKYGITFYPFLRRMTAMSTEDELSYWTLYRECDIEMFMVKFIDFLKNKFELTTMEKETEVEELTEKTELEKACEELSAELPEPANTQEPEYVTPEPVEPEKGSPFKVESQSIHSQFMLNIPVGEIFKQAVKEHMSNGGGEKIATEAREIIKRELASLAPNYVTIDRAEPVEIKGTLHKQFELSLKLLTSEKQIFLSGPAGSGKSTLGEQLAEALQVKFAHISCTSGMSEAHLLGRMVADGSYILSEFVDLYENGGVFLFDEIDAADANTLLIINSALANGRVSIPNRKDKPYAKRHDNFYAVCAGNTWGRGSSEYSGRMLLDAAFLDRFSGGKIEVNYDPDLEKNLLSAYPTMRKRLDKARDNIKKHQLRRIISTRAYASAARLLQVMPEDQFIDVLTTGWGKEEREKAFN